MADKRSGGYSTRLAVEGPRKILDKEMENIERERKVSRKEFEKEKTYLTGVVDARQNPRRPSSQSITGSSAESQLTYRPDNAEFRMDPFMAKDKAATEACDQLKLQFEMTLAALLDIEHPINTDRRASWSSSDGRPGPSKGGSVSEDPGSAITVKTTEGSSTPPSSLKKPLTIEERFLAIIGQPNEIASSSGLAASAQDQICRFNVPRKVSPSIRLHHQQMALRLLWIQRFCKRIPLQPGL
ncbi:uncharacterized protein LOC112553431 isoform X1 [Pomacea canaliculata]|uniref:uncharacterized protein LOC112553431 isoform X1 n=1 Tax=Pomacea canaliculata TaxID=400727 RepID=UPI000D733977|nr:uncharacterized protein LOC112553431 isoform X1 [Pomacea canaliculata]